MLPKEERSSRREPARREYKRFVWRAEAWFLPFVANQIGGDLISPRCDRLPDPLTAHPSRPLDHRGLYTKLYLQ